MHTLSYTPYLVYTHFFEKFMQLTFLLVHIEETSDSLNFWQMVYLEKALMW